MALILRDWNLRDDQVEDLKAGKGVKAPVAPKRFGSSSSKSDSTKYNYGRWRDIPARTSVATTVTPSRPVVQEPREDEQHLMAKKFTPSSTITRNKMETLQRAPKKTPKGPTEEQSLLQLKSTKDSKDTRVAPKEKKDETKLRTAEFAPNSILDRDIEGAKAQGSKIDEALAGNKFREAQAAIQATVEKDTGDSTLLDLAEDDELNPYQKVQLLSQQERANRQAANELVAKAEEARKLQTDLLDKRLKDEHRRKETDRATEIRRNTGPSVMFGVKMAKPVEEMSWDEFNALDERGQNAIRLNTLLEEAREKDNLLADALDKNKDGFVSVAEAGDEGKEYLDMRAERFGDLGRGTGDNVRYAPHLLGVAELLNLDRSDRGVSMEGMYHGDLSVNEKERLDDWFKKDNDTSLREWYDPVERTYRTERPTTPGSRDRWTKNTMVKNIGDLGRALENGAFILGDTRHSTSMIDVNSEQFSNLVVSIREGMKAGARFDNLFKRNGDFTTPRFDLSPLDTKEQAVKIDAIKTLYTDMTSPESRAAGMKEEHLKDRKYIEAILDQTEYGGLFTYEDWMSMLTRRQNDLSTGIRVGNTEVRKALSSKPSLMDLDFRLDLKEDPADLMGDGSKLPEVKEAAEEQKETPPEERTVKSEIPILSDEEAARLTAWGNEQIRKNEEALKNGTVNYLPSGITYGE